MLEASSPYSRACHVAGWRGFWGWSKMATPNGLPLIWPDKSHHSAGLPQTAFSPLAPREFVSVGLSEIALATRTAASPASLVSAKVTGPPVGVKAEVMSM